MHRAAATCLAYFTNLRFLFLSFFFFFSSDVVWELKPKKKSRWKTLSTKEAELLENRFKEYIESGPVDNAVVELENNFQVII